MTHEMDLKEWVGSIYNRRYGMLQIQQDILFNLRGKILEKQIIVTNKARKGKMV